MQRQLQQRSSYMRVRGRGLIEQKGCAWRGGVRDRRFFAVTASARGSVEDTAVAISESALGSQRERRCALEAGGGAG